MTATATEAPVAEESPALKKARAVLAEGRGFTFAEMTEMRHAMDAAGRNTLECAILKAVTGEVDRRSDQVLRAHIAAQNEAVQIKVAAHAAARPERWAALSPALRAAYLAGDKTTEDIARALMSFAKLLEQDTSKTIAPERFEPPRW